MVEIDQAVAWRPRCQIRLLPVSSPSRCIMDYFFVCICLVEPNRREISILVVTLNALLICPSVSREDLGKGSLQNYAGRKRLRSVHGWLGGPTHSWG